MIKQIFGPVVLALALFHSSSSFANDGFTEAYKSAFCLGLLAERKVELYSLRAEMEGSHRLKSFLDAFGAELESNKNLADRLSSFISSYQRVNPRFLSMDGIVSGKLEYLSCQRHKNNCPDVDKNCGQFDGSNFVSITNYFVCYDAIQPLRSSCLDRALGQPSCRNVSSCIREGKPLR